MPSLFAASITVLPCGTCTARPSTSMFSNGCDRPALAAGAAALPPGGAELAPWDGAAALAAAPAGAAAPGAGVVGLPPATAPVFTGSAGVVTASDIGRDEALLVLDVVREFAAEMPDEALDRQCRRIAERADRAAH